MRRSGGGGGGYGGGGGFGGGGGAAGPYVVPGTYTVELLAGTTVIDSKPMTIIMDPEVKLTAAARVAYNAVATDLHETQRRGQRVASALSALGLQLLTVQGKVKAATNVSDAVKAQVEALGKQFDSVRVKFGVPAAVAPGTGGGRGAAAAGAAAGAGAGGGGRGGADPANVLGKVIAAKSNIIAFWESPSAGTLMPTNTSPGRMSATACDFKMCGTMSMKLPRSSVLMVTWNISGVPWSGAMNITRVECRTAAPAARDSATRGPTPRSPILIPPTSRRSGCGCAGTSRSTPPPRRPC
mgnify:CR=1 FL=1